MKLFDKKTLCLAVLLPLLFWAGCQRPEPAEVAVSDIRSGRRLVAVTAVMPPEDPHAVKSAFTGSDYAVANYNLLVFEAGKLAAKYYKDSGSDLAFEVMADRAYNYYCVANVGDCTDAFMVGETPESRMAAWYIEAPVAGAAGLPMAWSGTGIRFSKARMRAGARLEIELTRLVAQYDIVLDKSALRQYSFTATALSLCGPASVAPFAISKAASVAVRTDYAPAADLARLNGGQKSTYYPLENRYGELLPANDDPWRKVPENLAESDHPSYIELEGLAVPGDGSGLEIPVTYRFYLGRNATRDFDVRRNEVNTVTLALTDEAIGREEPSWKVEKGSYTDSRALAFEDESLHVPGGGTADELIVRTPANLKYVVTLDPVLAAAGITVAGVTPGEPVDWDVLTFAAPDGIEPAQGKVTIRTIDGRKSDELTLTAGRQLQGLRFGLWPDAATERFHSDTSFLFGGQFNAHVYAVYTDGSREDITASLAAADFQFDDAYFYCDHVFNRLGQFRPKQAGQSQIKVTQTIDGVTATAVADILVRPKLVGLNVGSGSPVTLLTGGIRHQFTVKAVYSGAESRDISAEAVWAVADEEMLINGGGGQVTTKLKTGTTSVHVGYTENGLSFQRDIEVRITKTPVELHIFPSVVYLPNAGSVEYAAGENNYEQGGPNDRYFRLTAYYHDGTYEDVSHAPGKTMWTDNMPLRYTSGDGVWHILGIQSRSNEANPGRMIIYRSCSNSLNGKVRLGNVRDRYDYHVHQAVEVTESSPQKFLEASYTLNGVTLTAEVMGTMVNTAKPLRITISPNPQEAYAGGHSVQFNAMLEYDDGTTEDITARAGWSVDDLATSEGGGRFTTGTETGSTQVHASLTASGVTVAGDAGLTINPRVVTDVALEVNPGTGWTASDTDVNLGAEQAWRLRITYENGDVEYQTKGFPLESSHPEVVTVSGAGTTAVAIGHADITAAYGSHQAGPVRLTVLNHHYSYELLVTPENTTIDSDGTAFYHAWYVTRDNGVETEREDVSSACSWSVSSGLAAYVDVSGAFIVKANGSNSSLVYGLVEAACTLGGTAFSDYATLRIRAPFVPSLSVGQRSLEWDYDEYGADCAQTIAVTGNVSWSAEIVGTGTHFALSATSGEGNGTLKVYPAERNGSSSERTARLRIYNSDYDLEWFIDLTHLSFDRRKGVGPVYNKLLVTPSEVTIDHDGEFTFTATLLVYRDAAMTDLFQSFDVSRWDWSHWTSSDETAAVMRSPHPMGPPHVANAMAKGMNTRVGNGYKETTVHCHYGPEIPSGMTISDAATLRVKDIPDQTLYRLSVSVDPASIGNTGRAQATALLQQSSDGGATWTAGENVSAATAWSSSDVSAATIAASGAVTGCNTELTAKTVRISGTYSGVSPAVSDDVQLQVSGVSPFLDVTPGQLSWDWDESGSTAGQTLTIASNLSWSLSVPSGFGASSTSGDGDAVVTVWPTSRNNSKTTDRTGTIRITASGATARTVSLKQGHNPGSQPPQAAYLSFDQSHYELVKLSGGSVTTTCAFTLTLHAGDGTTSDVTARASYSDQGGIAVDGSAGTLEATAPASSKTLTARYDGLTATATYTAEDLAVPVSLEGDHVEIQGGSGREFLVETFEVVQTHVLSGARSREEVTASVTAETSGPIVCDGFSSGRGILFRFTAPGSGSVYFSYKANGVEVSCMLELTCASDNTITYRWR